MAQSSCLLAFAFTALVLAACDSTSPKPSVGQAVISPASATISVGQSIHLNATATGVPVGTPYIALWVSTDTTLARVDATGLVLGVRASPGVQICASVTREGSSSYAINCATITVEPAPPCPGPSTSTAPPCVAASSATAAIAKR